VQDDGACDPPGDEGVFDLSRKGHGNELKRRDQPPLLSPADATPLTLPRPLLTGLPPPPL